MLAPLLYDLDTYIRRARTARNGFECGYIGEQIAQFLLEDAGYTVDKPDGYYQGDLTVITAHGELISVEVKTARLNKNNEARATIRKHDKHGSTDSAWSQFVLLLVIAEDVYPFIIPSENLTGKSIGITGHPKNYRGKWDAFRHTIPIRLGRPRRLFSRPIPKANTAKFTQFAPDNLAPPLDIWQPHALHVLPKQQPEQTAGQAVSHA